jgi:hypothetical protein
MILCNSCGAQADVRTTVELTLLTDAARRELEGVPAQHTQAYCIGCARLMGALTDAVAEHRSTGAGRPKA